MAIFAADIEALRLAVVDAARACIAEAKQGHSERAHVLFCLIHGAPNGLCRAESQYG